MFSIYFNVIIVEISSTLLDNYQLLTMKFGACYHYCFLFVSITVHGSSPELISIDADSFYVTLQEMTTVTLFFYEECPLNRSTKCIVFK